MSRKIGICMVAGDRIHSATAQCIAKLCYYHGIKGDDISFGRVENTVLAEARNQVIKETVEAGAEWIFCVDSDMTFPAETIDRLMSWEKPVVAANCTRRVRPISPIATINTDDGPQILWPDPDRHGLHEVRSFGAGVVLLHANVFQEIAWPWFGTFFDHERNRFVGEDIFFCGRVHDAGIPLYVDEGLSWHIGHIGEETYTLGHALGEKDLHEQGAWDGAQ